MQTDEIYRCDGCGTEYRVAGDGRPTVLCSECKQVASPRGDPVAVREYRVGHVTYLEGRRRTTEALGRFESGHLTLARGGFNDAAGEFETSVDHFTTAVKRAEGDGVADACERARKKATCLWQAVEWLGGSTYASEQGDMTRATQYRNDAQQRLRSAKEYGDLPDPEALLD
ncbi:hypothetical protein NDI56_05415 [Haloarcula sp. S1CR25-12]|uniref:Zinc ribbon domain-containing protein n=1 Tax=Haloarcula saliterrae TaxID=2950534 RepID=A0ABU2FAT9_9EURY|nr:hypothetical protein [Haloarcula sp. S1CR25-12]MDS0258831.1 hypothetical protein [Haloarcula sp. S1CR25-12]